ncbi:TBC1 domain family member 2B [Trichinella nativa]|uniref:TBC1 domain family member 2B n=1 Tax=Trichinella nativa TaxID=6335 RepID=A0A0V1KZH3_9BILA|nr:TBC1 domain family member 2B [Trichinella nativa]
MEQKQQSGLQLPQFHSKNFLNGYLLVKNVTSVLKRLLPRRRYFFVYDEEQECLLYYNSRLEWLKRVQPLGVIINDGSALPACESQPTTLCLKDSSGARYELTAETKAEMLAWCFMLQGIYKHGLGVFAKLNGGARSQSMKQSHSCAQLSRNVRRLYSLPASGMKAASSLDFDLNFEHFCRNCQTTRMMTGESMEKLLQSFQKVKLSNGSICKSTGSANSRVHSAYNNTTSVVDVLKSLVVEEAHEGCFEVVSLLLQVISKLEKDPNHNFHAEMENCFIDQVKLPHHRKKSSGRLRKHLQKKDHQIKVHCRVLRKFTEELFDYKKAYVRCLLSSVRVHTDDMCSFSEISFPIPPDETEYERIEKLANEAKHQDPSVATMEQIMSSRGFTDRYGFHHRTNDEQMAAIYVASCLQHHYTTWSQKNDELVWKKLIAVFNENGSLHTVMLRVWDCFLLEGQKVIYRFAMALFYLHRKEIVAQKDSLSLIRFLKSTVRNTYDVETLTKVADRILCMTTSNGDIFFASTLSASLFAFRQTLWEITIQDVILDMVARGGTIYAALSNGSLAFIQNSGDTTDCADFLNHFYIRISDASPIHRLLLVDNHLWLALGDQIVVYDAGTLDKVEQVKAASSTTSLGRIARMELSRFGIWIYQEYSNTVELWDPRFFTRILSFQVEEYASEPNAQFVSSMCCVEDTLWIGTRVGLLLVYKLEEHDHPADQLYRFRSCDSCFNQGLIFCYSPRDDYRAMLIHRDSGYCEGVAHQLSSDPCISGNDWEQLQNEQRQEIIGGCDWKYFGSLDRRQWALKRITEQHDCGQLSRRRRMHFGRTVPMLPKVNEKHPVYFASSSSSSSASFASSACSRLQTITTTNHTGKDNNSINMPTLCKAKEVAASSSPPTCIGKDNNLNDEWKLTLDESTTTAITLPTHTRSLLQIAGDRLNKPSYLALSSSLESLKQHNSPNTGSCLSVLSQQCQQCGDDLFEMFE